jgi:predicted TIM-barrel fold metal-dependent hydrolase
MIPVNEAVALSTEANDFVAAAVKRNATRFAGFAALPIAAPQTAADELWCHVSLRRTK